MRLADLAKTAPAPDAPRTPLAARLGVAFQAPLKDSDVLFERGVLGKSAIGDSEDLERVAALPRRPVPTKAQMAEMVAVMTALLSRPNDACECAELSPGAQDPCLRTLLPVQAWYLWEALRAPHGIFGPIGIGHGKTGIDILLPMVIPGCQVALLLVPPGLRKQLTTDYRRWSQHFRTPNLAGGTGPFWPDRPVLEVFPYSLLSRPEQTAYLRARNPDAFIGDEIHALANPDAVGTSRFLRFKAENAERVRCYFHSGSISGQGLGSFWHLAAAALHEGSPLPLDYHVTKNWAGAIDPLPPSKMHLRAPMGKLRKLCEPGEDVRSGFQRRLVETPWVISTREASLATKLQISARKVDVPEEITQAIRDVQRTGERPDGEPLLDIVQIKDTCRQLAYGFYYRWRFPHVYHSDGREAESDEERYIIVKEWFARRKAWFRELRDKLEHRSEHVDSPGLYTKAAIRFHAGYRGPLPTWNARMWPAWAEIRDRVEHVSDTVWVSDCLVKDAAEWARANTGIVWCTTTAFAHALAKFTGLPYYGRNQDPVLNLAPTKEMLARRDAKIRRGEEWHDRPSDWIECEDGTRSIVASIDAHGTGKNLQAWHRCLVANLPGDGGVWEQMLGRQHRRGQTQNICYCDVYQHTPEMEDALEKAREQARYKQKIEGAQRLLYAEYTFDPP